MSSIPILVKNDPWLESCTQAIQERMERFAEKLNVIESQYQSLQEFASAHLSLGPQFCKKTKTWCIREWAPAAKAIQLVGPFNQWDGSNYHFTQNSLGYWELSISAENFTHLTTFKLRITGADEQTHDRIPAAITRAVQNEETHDFSAQLWAPEQAYTWQHTYDASKLTTPLIYEAHVGMAGEEPRLHTYREFADHILPRIAALGYNIVQLMAVQEHPYYGSFGYHVSSFFGVCSRYGTPEDLKYLIDTAHSLGMAVLLDIIHSHAVKNTAEGLNRFDGSEHQYFHAGEAGEHPQWDSKCFDYSKDEVLQFLLSNVRYWLEEYRFDGFRFDGITSMLYEHHGTTAFDHYDKYFKDGVAHDAITYLQLATTLTKRIRPDALIIAEDMSGMPGLCRPIEEGGIGFTHRLAMGLPDYWIKLLKHQQDENWDIEELWATLTNRRYGEANIAYAESHDQALVGDKTLAFWLMDAEMYTSMSKDRRNHIIDRGLALHKMIRLLTATAAGEGYLTFMGNEFGHPEWLDFPREGNEWSYHYCRRQWSLADNHDLCYHFLRDFDQSMIHLLKANSCLQGFGNTYERWKHNEDKVLAFNRGDLMFIFNLHPTRSHEGYTIPVPEAGSYAIILNSDDLAFGGHDRVNAELPFISQTWEENEGHVIQCYLPTRTALVLKKA